LKALKDKNHPEHKHLVEWAGKFDSEDFDVDTINEKLNNYHQ